MVSLEKKREEFVLTEYVDGKGSAYKKGRARGSLKITIPILTNSGFYVMDHFPNCVLEDR